MSLLVLHAAHAENDSPEILSFSDWKPRIEADRNRKAVRRARLEYHNQSCPSCGRTTVEPIELDDYRMNRNGAPVPGTATVVGFSCNACHEMWKG
jgi:hypothetical protein